MIWYLRGGNIEYEVLDHPMSENFSSLDDPYWICFDGNPAGA
jgi:hypothetical protein